VSRNLASRFRAHSRKAHWWPLVASKTVELHPTRREGLAAETAAINAENPVYNILRPAIRPPRVARLSRAPRAARKAKAAPPPRCRVRGPRPEGAGAPAYDARLALNLTLTEVARRCAAEGAPVCAEAIAKFERGGGLMRPKALPVLATVLGMTRSDVIDIAIAQWDRQMAARSAT
jgi:hypothetical protein